MINTKNDPRAAALPGGHFFVFPAVKAQENQCELDLQAGSHDQIFVTMENRNLYPAK